MGGYRPGPLTRALDGVARPPASDPAATGTHTTTVLEQVTTALTRVEERLTSLTQTTTASTHLHRTAEPEVVQWLEEEDLTGRLQAILRRQAHRHGIDLSR